MIDRPLVASVPAAVALAACLGGSPGALDAGSAAPWSWIPVEGSRCASGARAGIAASLGSDDVFIYLVGGGACWNQGSCVPSPLAYGPVCSYGGLCLYDGPGGTQPTAAYVRAPDPFPAAFEGDLALARTSRIFDREDAANPFRAATFVFVPYCTGDLHAGDAVRTFDYKADVLGPVLETSFHFAGATNMDRYLDWLAQARPGVRRIWLTGSSGGGYGATLNFDRVQRRFPGAEVHLLADSAPLIDSVRFDQWRDVWNLQLPRGCSACAAGMPQVLAHLATTYPSRRLALLAFDHDKVISWFFLAGEGLDQLVAPPTGVYATRLGALLATYDGSAAARYFVLPGEEHVMIGGYGARLPAGGFSTPRAGPAGAPDLKTWIDAWATDGAAWRSTR